MIAALLSAYWSISVDGGAKQTGETIREKTTCVSSVIMAISFAYSKNHQKVIKQVVIKLNTSFLMYKKLTKVRALYWP